MIGYRTRTWGSGLLVAGFLVACGGADEPGALGSEGAHEHGVARVNIAVDGMEASIEFVSPAMGIYGFEHEATSAEDLRRQEEGLATLRSRSAELFVLDSDLGCRVEPVRVGMGEEEHAHADDEHAHADEHSGDEHAGADEHAHNHEHAAGADPAPAAEQGTPDVAGAGDGAGVASAPEPQDDHGHAEVHAEFLVTCQSPLSGSRILFAVADVFPGIEHLDVQVVGDQVTGGRFRASGSGVDL